MIILVNREKPKGDAEVTASPRIYHVAEFVYGWVSFPSNMGQPPNPGPNPGPE